MVVLGPAEAPLAVIKGRYRFRILVKSARGFDLSDYLRNWLAVVPEAEGQSEARGRRRSAELFVRSRRAIPVIAERSEAIQDPPRIRSGLLRRCAPRNDALE